MKTGYLLMALVLIFSFLAGWFAGTGDNPVIPVVMMMANAVTTWQVMSGVRSIGHMDVYEERR
jgi:hypothetical protein